MLSTFTELNRKRPKRALFDFVTHTTCSIVHAADDRSVMETLETLPAIIASTRAMIGEKPYRIGPSAIAARMNPYGKGVLDNPDERPRLPHEQRSSPARPVQRGLDARLCRRLRLRRTRGRGAWRNDRPAWVHPPPFGRPSAALFRFARRPCRLSRVPCDGRPGTRAAAIILSRRNRPSRGRRPRSRGGRTRALCCGSQISPPSP